MMNLLNCYLPVFRLITAFLLHPQQHSDYDAFREKCMSLLQYSLHESELHHEQQDCDNALFAVVLWLDERVLCSAATWVKKWQGELLQSHYFNISVGGEAFYFRLDEIEQSNVPVRIVYLFCLLMGFHGKYTGQCAQRLQKRIDKERQCLPEAWRMWPNDASLVEQPVPYDKGNYLRKIALLKNKIFLFAVPLCLYLLMLTAGFGIFTW